MTKIVPAVLLILFATAAFAGWSTHGPTGGAATAVVVAPSDANAIWAGTSAGVFRTTDGGATWSDVSGPVVDVRYLAASAADALEAWAVAGYGVGGARIYRTTDGGAAWRDVTAGLPPLFEPSSFFADPRERDTIYVSSSQCNNAPGVFKSSDGGATWRQLVLPGSTYRNCVQTLTIDPFSPWRLFTLPAYPEVASTMESYDGGATWEPPRDVRPDTAVVFDARFPFTHYGIGQFHFFVVSQDGGFTWQTLQPAILGGGDLFFRSGRVGTSLAMDPERSRIFLGAFDGVFRSGNGGTVWARTALQNEKVTMLAFGGTPRALFAATPDGLMAVENRGLGAAHPVDLHDASAPVLGIATDPHDPRVVYASAVGGRIDRSNDAGASWQRMAGDSGTDVLSLLTVGADGELYGLPSPGGAPLYRRKPGDDTWRVTQLNDGGFVAADPKNPGTAFLADGGTILRTRDGGDTWQHVADAPLRAQLAIDPSDPRWVYVAGYRQFLRSSDGGDTWTSFPADLSGPIVVAPSDGNVLYRFTNSILQRSDDRGTTWRTILQPKPAPILQSIAVDPRDANSLWIGGNPILHSADGGATWQEVPPPFRLTFEASQLRFSADGSVLHVVFPNGHGVWELTR